MAIKYVGEDKPCNLCGSQNRRLIAEKDRDGAALTTVMCEGCGLVYTHPMPSNAEVAQYYGEDYRTSYKGSFRPPLKHTYRSGIRCLERFDRLKEFLSPGVKILDLGAGSGEFTYLLRRRGLDAQGLEPNDGYGTFARDTLGLPIKIGTYETADFEADSFDIITAHHVIEHLVDPTDAFGVLAGWLKPGGVLIGEVPNIDATYHAPATKFHFAHVYNYSPATFIAMAAKAGLACIDLITVPGTQHVNAVFEKGGTAKVKLDLSDGAQATHQVLSRHTPTGHYFQSAPYRRLAANLMRPIREKRALNGRSDPRDVLNALYDAAAR